jgi:hypothetical protein
VIQKKGTRSGKIEGAEYIVTVGPPICPEGMTISVKVGNGQDAMRAYFKLCHIAEDIKEREPKGPR